MRTEQTRCQAHERVQRTSDHLPGVSDGAQATTFRDFLIGNGLAAKT